MRARKARLTVARGGGTGASPQGSAARGPGGGSVYVRPSPAPGGAPPKRRPGPRAQPSSASPRPTSSTFRRPQTV